MITDRDAPVSYCQQDAGTKASLTFRHDQHQSAMAEKSAEKCLNDGGMLQQGVSPGKGRTDASVKQHVATFVCRAATARQKEVFNEPSS